MKWIVEALQTRRCTISRDQLDSNAGFNIEKPMQSIIKEMDFLTKNKDCSAHSGN